MSLDNGVFILQLKSKNPYSNYEYRVSLLHAMENVFNDPEMLIDSFNNSKIYYDFEQAKKIANKLDLVNETEYGVGLLQQFKDHYWSDIEDIIGVSW